MTNTGEGSLNLPRMETNQTLPSVMKIHSLNVLYPLPCHQDPVSHELSLWWVLFRSPTQVTSHFLFECLLQTMPAPSGIGHRLLNFALERKETRDLKQF